MHGAEEGDVKSFILLCFLDLLVFYEGFFGLFLFCCSFGVGFVLTACAVLVGGTGHSGDVEGSLALSLPQSWVEQDGGAWPPVVAL